MAITCPYGMPMKSGMRSWIQCEKMNKMCVFQRYCRTERKVVHSNDAEKCKLRMDNGK